MPADTSIQFDFGSFIDAAIESNKMVGGNSMFDIARNGAKALEENYESFFGEGRSMYDDGVAEIMAERNKENPDSPDMSVVSEDDIRERVRGKILAEMTRKQFLEVIPEKAFEAGNEMIEAGGIDSMLSNIGIKKEDYQDSLDNRSTVIFENLFKRFAEVSSAMSATSPLDMEMSISGFKEKAIAGLDPSLGDTPIEKIAIGGVNLAMNNFADYARTVLPEKEAEKFIEDSAKIAAGIYGSSIDAANNETVANIAISGRKVLFPGQDLGLGARVGIRGVAGGVSASGKTNPKLELVMRSDLNNEPQVIESVEVPSFFEYGEALAQEMGELADKHRAAKVKTVDASNEGSVEAFLRGAGLPFGARAEDQKNIEELQEIVEQRANLVDSIKSGPIGLAFSKAMRRSQEHMKKEISRFDEGYVGMAGKPSNIFDIHQAKDNFKAAVARGETPGVVDRISGEFTGFVGNAAKLYPEVARGGLALFGKESETLNNFVRNVTQSSQSGRAQINGLGIARTATYEIYNMFASMGPGKAVGFAAKSLTGKAKLAAISQAIVTGTMMSSRSSGEAFDMAMGRSSAETVEGKRGEAQKAAIGSFATDSLLESAMAGFYDKAYMKAADSVKASRIIKTTLNSIKKDGIEEILTNTAKYTSEIQKSLFPNRIGKVLFAAGSEYHTEATQQMAMQIAVSEAVNDYVMDAGAPVDEGTVGAVIGAVMHISNSVLGRRGRIAEIEKYLREKGGEVDGEAMTDEYIKSQARAIEQLELNRKLIDTLVKTTPDSESAAESDAVVDPEDAKAVRDDEIRRGIGGYKTAIKKMVEFSDRYSDSSKISQKTVEEALEIEKLIKDSESLLGRDFVATNELLNSIIEESGVSDEALDRANGRLALTLAYSEIEKKKRDESHGEQKPDSDAKADDSVSKGLEAGGKESENDSQDAKAKGQQAKEVQDQGTKPSGSSIDKVNEALSILAQLNGEPEPDLLFNRDMDEESQETKVSGEEMGHSSGGGISLIAPTKPTLNLVNSESWAFTTPKFTAKGIPVDITGGVGTVEVLAENSYAEIPQDMSDDDLIRYMSKNGNAVQVDLASYNDVAGLRSLDTFIRSKSGGIKELTKPVENAIFRMLMKIPALKDKVLAFEGNITPDDSISWYSPKSRGIFINTRFLGQYASDHPNPDELLDSALQEEVIHFSAHEAVEDMVFEETGSRSGPEFSRSKFALLKKAWDSIPAEIKKASIALYGSDSSTGREAIGEFLRQGVQILGGFKTTEEVMHPDDKKIESDAKVLREFWTGDNASNDLLRVVQKIDSKLTDYKQVTNKYENKGLTKPLPVVKIRTEQGAQGSIEPKRENLTSPISRLRKGTFFKFLDKGKNGFLGGTGAESLQVGDNEIEGILEGSYSLFSNRLSRFGTKKSKILNSIDSIDPFDSDDLDSSSPKSEKLKELKYLEGLLAEKSDRLIEGSISESNYDGGGAELRESDDQVLKVQAPVQRTRSDGRVYRSFTPVEVLVSNSLPNGAEVAVNLKGKTPFIAVSRSAIMDLARGEGSIADMEIDMSGVRQLDGEWKGSVARSTFKDMGIVKVKDVLASAMDEGIGAGEARRRINEAGRLIALIGAWTNGYKAQLSPQQLAELYHGSGFAISPKGTRVSATEDITRMRNSLDPKDPNIEIETETITRLAQGDVEGAVYSSLMEFAGYNYIGGNFLLGGLIKSVSDRITRLTSGNAQEARRASSPQSVRAYREKIKATLSEAHKLIEDLSLFGGNSKIDKPREAMSMTKSTGSSSFESYGPREIETVVIPAFVALSKVKGSGVTQSDVNALIGKLRVERNRSEILQGRRDAEGSGDPPKIRERLVDLWEALSMKYEASILTGDSVNMTKIGSDALQFVNSNSDIASDDGVNFASDSRESWIRTITYANSVPSVLQSGVSVQGAISKINKIDTGTLDAKRQEEIEKGEADMKFYRNLTEQEKIAHVARMTFTRGLGVAFQPVSREAAVEMAATLLSEARSSSFSQGEMPANQSSDVFRMILTSFGFDQPVIHTANYSPMYGEPHGVSHEATLGRDIYSIISPVGERYSTSGVGTKFSTGSGEISGDVIQNFEEKQSRRRAVRFIRSVATELIRVVSGDYTGSKVMKLSSMARIAKGESLSPREVRDLVRQFPPNSDETRSMYARARAESPNSFKAIYLRSLADSMFNIGDSRYNNEFGTSTEEVMARFLIDAEFQSRLASIPMTGMTLRTSKSGEAYNEFKGGLISMIRSPHLTDLNQDRTALSVISEALAEMIYELSLSRGTYPQVLTISDQSISNMGESHASEEMSNEASFLGSINAVDPLKISRAMIRSGKSPVLADITGKVVSLSQLSHESELSDQFIEDKVSEDLSEASSRAFRMMAASPKMKSGMELSYANLVSLIADKMGFTAPRKQDLIKRFREAVKRKKPIQVSTEDFAPKEGVNLRKFYSSGAAIKGLADLANSKTFQKATEIAYSDKEGESTLVDGFSASEVSTLGEVFGDIFARLDSSFTTMTQDESIDTFDPSDEEVSESDQAPKSTGKIIHLNSFAPMPLMLGYADQFGGDFNFVVTAAAGLGVVYVSTKMYKALGSLMRAIAGKLPSEGVIAAVVSTLKKLFGKFTNQDLLNAAKIVHSKAHNVFNGERHRFSRTKDIPGKDQNTKVGKKLQVFTEYTMRAMRSNETIREILSPSNMAKSYFDQMAKFLTSMDKDSLSEGEQQAMFNALSKASNMLIPNPRDIFDFYLRHSSAVPLTKEFINEAAAAGGAPNAFKDIKNKSAAIKVMSKQLIMETIGKTKTAEDLIRKLFWLLQYGDYSTEGASGREGAAAHARLQYARIKEVMPETVIDRSHAWLAGQLISRTGSQAENHKERALSVIQDFAGTIAGLLESESNRTEAERNGIISDRGDVEAHMEALKKVSGIAAKYIGGKMTYDEFKSEIESTLSEGQKKFLDVARYEFASIKNDFRAMSFLTTGRNVGKFEGYLPHGKASYDKDANLEGIDTRGGVSEITPAYSPRGKEREYGIPEGVGVILDPKLLALKSLISENTVIHANVPRMILGSVLGNTRYDTVAGTRTKVKDAKENRVLASLDRNKGRGGNLAAAESAIEMMRMVVISVLEADHSGQANPSAYMKMYNALSSFAYAKILSSPAQILKQFMPPLVAYSTENPKAAGTIPVVFARMMTDEKFREAMMSLMALWSPSVFNRGMDSLNDIFKKSDISNTGTGSALENLVSGKEIRDTLEIIGNISNEMMDILVGNPDKIASSVLWMTELMGQMGVGATASAEKILGSKPPTAEQVSRANDAVSHLMGESDPSLRPAWMQAQKSEQATMASRAVFSLTVTATTIANEFQRSMMMFRKGDRARATKRAYGAIVQAAAHAALSPRILLGLAYVALGVKPDIERDEKLLDLAASWVGFTDHARKNAPRDVQDLFTEWAQGLSDDAINYAPVPAAAFRSIPAQINAIKTLAQSYQGMKIMRAALMHTDLGDIAGIEFGEMIDSSEGLPQQMNTILPWLGMAGVGAVEALNLAAALSSSDLTATDKAKLSAAVAFAPTSIIQKIEKVTQKKMGWKRTAFPKPPKKKIKVLKPVQKLIEWWESEPVGDAYSQKMKSKLTSSDGFETEKDGFYKINEMEYLVGDFNDGDSFTMKDANGHVVRVRLANVNTAETRVYKNEEGESRMAKDISSGSGSFLKAQKAKIASREMLQGADSVTLITNFKPVTDDSSRIWGEILFTVDGETKKLSEELSKSGLTEPSKVLLKIPEL